MHADVPVKEVMSREVCTADADENLHSAAKKMIEFGVGSIVVLVNGVPSGIVTEKDILGKVVAENRKPSEVKLKEIMSSPVIFIQPKTSVREAADIMLKKGIRRLPVVENGKLVGIVMDTDILTVSMDIGELLGLIRERSEHVLEIETIEVMGGKCERCGKFSDRLIEVNGQKLCEDCADSFE